MIFHTNHTVSRGDRPVVDGVQADVQHWPARVPARQLQPHRLLRAVALPRLLRAALPGRPLDAGGRPTLQRHTAGAGGPAGPQPVGLRRSPGVDI